MLSSLASMMYQFYMEYRENSWVFDASSMFSKFLHIEGSDVPCTKHQWFINIDESSMKLLWITDDEIAMFTCSMAEFKAMKLRTLYFKSSFPITLSGKLSENWFERQRAILRTLSETILAAILKIEFCLYRGTFLGKIDSKFIFFSGLSGKNFWLVLSKLNFTCLEDHFGRVFFSWKKYKFWFFLQLQRKNLGWCS